jgi:hypothetical protein
MIRKGHAVLIGDADGIDKAVQVYFADEDYSNVVVYCSGELCRNNVGNWNVRHVDAPPKVRGRKFYMLKDSQMAMDADYGFLIWDGKSAGTINNLSNLIESGKIGLVYLMPIQNYFTIRDRASFLELLTKCNPGDIDIIDEKIGFRKKLQKREAPVQLQVSLDLSETAIPSDNEAIMEQSALIVKETDAIYGQKDGVEKAPARTNEAQNGGMSMVEKTKQTPLSLMRRSETGKTDLSNASA